MNVSWFKLVLWVGLCLLAGFIGSFFAPGEWYISLRKSSLTPPNIVFPIVWNILFILMGIAAWRISEKQQKIISLALTLFLIQLIFNILWSYLFFGMRRPDLALIEILVLWIFILSTTIVFYKIDKMAGNLLMPYLVWVGFACYLNYSIYSLN